MYEREVDIPEAPEAEAPAARDRFPDTRQAVIGATWAGGSRRDRSGRIERVRKIPGRQSSCTLGERNRDLPTCVKSSQRG